MFHFPGTSKIIHRGAHLIEAGRDFRHARKYSPDKLNSRLVKMMHTPTLQVLGRIDGTVAQEERPVLAAHQRVELFSGQSHGIESADNAAHRRSRDNIDRYARPLQHFQHTNVRHALRAATGEHHCHAGPLTRRHLRERVRNADRARGMQRRGKQLSTGCQEEKQERKESVHKYVKVYFCCKYNQKLAENQNKAKKFSMSPKKSIPL